MKIAAITCMSVYSPMMIRSFCCEDTWVCGGAVALNVGGIDIDFIISQPEYRRIGVKVTGDTR